MGCEPTQLGQGVTVNWTIPKEVSDRTDVDLVRVFRSAAEDSGYAKIDDIAYPRKTYSDIAGNRSKHYLVTFAASMGAYESCYHLTFFRPTPRQARIIEQIRRAMPKVIQDTMTDEDYLNGLNLAVQIFNVYPPQTYFNLDNFPLDYEYFLVGLGQLTALASRFLPLSIRDWRYSEPGGIVMDIDRGAKINAAMEIITNTYTQYLPLVKLDFAAESPMGLGTIQLPLSMGGVVSRGLLNVLDIFTATGR